jgi:cell wall-associated NlpC family hydrolase
MRYLFFLFLFAGCSQIDYSKKVAEDVGIDYFAEKYTSSAEIDLEKFKSEYFEPWNIDEVSEKEPLWQYDDFLEHAYKGENKLPLLESEKLELLKNSNLENFGVENRKGITTSNTSLRLFPTEKPIFKETWNFPFDYNQNSALKIGKPIFISHYSKDRAWAFVQSSFTMGWIPVTNLQILDNESISKFQNSEFIVILKDRTPIYKNSKFLFYSKLATLFPISKELENSFEISLPDGEITEVSKDVAQRFPLKMSSKSVKDISKELLKEKYGWGGLFSNRDCSAMTRDFFIPFGIWLPRNSKAQIDYLNSKSVSEILDIEEREKEILKYAKPFETILYLKGHVMLYIGEYKNQAFILHNLWGLKSKEAGDRKLYGRTIISNLYLGAEDSRVFKESLLINRISGVGNIFQK